MLLTTNGRSVTTPPHTISDSVFLVVQSNHYNVKISTQRGINRYKMTRCVIRLIVVQSYSFAARRPVVEFHCSWQRDIALYNFFCAFTVRHWVTQQAHALTRMHTRTNTAFAVLTFLYIRLLCLSVEATFLVSPTEFDLLAIR